MDVSNEFQKVRIFFADDGFVTVLEEVTATFVTFIESYGITRHETAHNFAEWACSSAQE